MNKKISVSVSLAVAIIAMTVTVAITWIVAMSLFDTAVASVVDRQAQFEKLAEIDTYVRDRFFGEIDNNYLSDRTAQGYVQGLGDKYSVYYTEKEFTELQQIEKGELVGIGIEIVKDVTNYYRIARVYDDSPAAKAGVTAGGLITKVDGVDTKTVTSVKNMHSLLRGRPGETIDLTCLYGASEEKNFSFQRDNYQAPTVEPFIMDEGVAYIRISSFDSRSYTDFDYILREALAAQPKALVFDVRDNQGGSYKTAYQMIDLLCPTGTIAKSEAKNGTIKVVATSGEEYVDLPMVVLVNENTAAAAEIFAASIRDLSGGKIVGTTTQGHGTLQSTPKRLSDGSAISITEALLLTGKEQSYNGVGLEPDIEVLVGAGEDLNLFAPDIKTDQQISRALEVARSFSNNTPLPESQPAESVVESGAAEASSLPEASSLSGEEAGSVSSASVQGAASSSSSSK